MKANFGPQFAEDPFLSQDLLSAFVLASSWNTFLLAHTLDPNDPETANFQNWDADSWNRWLADREVLHQRENKYHGQLLTEKGVNSVIVATPEEIESTFAHPRFVMCNELLE
ncbi:unnamed protein product [Allacma fusca]|uniref:Uncharacterized protein n=1 Tax=Allacma fusca TaxID=39272 RepID=A0A8J2KVE6_9HEXA|nr:unnamed protein product [Allacma fusca]